jgi:hypothetical protein
MKAVLDAAWAIQRSTKKDPPNPGAITMDSGVAAFNMTAEEVSKIVEALSLATPQVCPLNDKNGGFRLLSEPAVILQELASGPTGELPKEVP